MWNHRGQQRPDFAETPGPDQESVWDYPRPPALDSVKALAEVYAGEERLAQTEHIVRVLETASPPTVYLPPEAVNRRMLITVKQTSFCEWKGVATYWSLVKDPEHPVAWSYAQPMERFRDIADWFSFYPGLLHCVLDGERVRAQSGGFYGGWVTDRIVGPWKGQAGTNGW